MPAIISVIGRSNTGKTTLIEKLIRHFNTKGYKISIIKHMKHDFIIDHPGKDTWRYREAGAFASAISNDRRFALISDIDGTMPPLALAERFMEGADLVIIEGYKEGEVPKIEVIGDAPEPPLYLGGVRNIIALVTDRDLAADFPLFRRDDIEGVAAFIEDMVF